MYQSALGLVRELRDSVNQVLVGGVVQHQVHNDADVALSGLGDEAVEVSQGAVLRVDILVVGDVIAEVDLRRRIDRGVARWAFMLSFWR